MRPQAKETLGNKYLAGTRGPSQAGTGEKQGQVGTGWLTEGLKCQALRMGSVVNLDFSSLKVWQSGTVLSNIH